MEALQAEADRVRSLIQGIQESIDSVGKIGDNYKQSTKGSNGHAKAKEDTDALAAANEKLLQSQKLLDAEKEKAVTLETNLARQIAIQQELNKKKQADLRAEAKDVAGLNDAYRKLELQYNAAQRAAKNLAATPGSSQEAIAAANEQALSLSNQLKAIDAATGQYNRKVGDYIGAVSILDKTLQDTNNHINQLSQTQTNNAQRTQQLITELNELSVAGQENSRAWVQIKGQIDALNRSEQQHAETMATATQQSELLTALLNQQARGFTSVTMEIRANERALFSLKEAGMEDSEAFKQIQMSVAKAHRELNEFNKGQKILESTDPALKAATISAKGLAGAYALGAGASALLANGDEKVEKELNKLVAVMTIMQGLQEVSELLHQRNAIALAFETGVTRIAELAQKAWAATMMSSVAATMAFRIALIGLTGGLLLLIPLVSFAFGKMSESMKDARVEKEQLEEVNKKSIDNYAEEEIHIKMVIAQLKDENISRKLKKDMIDDLKKQYPDYLENIKNEGTLTTELSDAIQNKLIPALELEAKAKAAQALATEKFKKILELQEDPTEAVSIWDKIGSGIRNFGNLADASLDLVKTAQKNVGDQTKELQGQIDALFKISLQADEQLSKLGKGNKKDQDAIDKELKARTALINLIREQAILELKPVEDNKVGPGYARVKAFQQEFELRKAIIESSRDLELHNAKLTATERVVIQQKAAFEILNAERDLSVQILGVHADELQKMKDDEKLTQDEMAAQWAAYWKSHEDALKLSFQIQKNYLDEARDIELEALADKASKGLISEEDYNKQKKKIIDEALKFTLQANLKEIEAQKALAIAKNENLPKDQQIDLTVFDTQAASIKKQLAENTAADVLATKKKAAEDEKKLIDQVADYEKKAEETVTAFVHGANQKKLNGIQDQINQNNKLKDQATERIATETASEQTKANQLQLINARTAAQNDILVQKQNEVKEKQAKFDRDKSIFDILAGTATSIIKTAADVGYPAAIPLQIIAAAEGAAQLAAVLAQPIPKFEKGGTAKRGLAIWGEKGREAAISPSGKVSFSPDHASLTYIPESGTEIIPHDELNRVMYRAMIKETASMITGQKDGMSDRKLDGIKSAIDNQTQSLEKINRNQRTPIVNINIDPGWDAYIKKYVKD